MIKKAIRAIVRKCGYDIAYPLVVRNKKNRPQLITDGELLKFLKDFDIKILDVGARGGLEQRVIGFRQFSRIYLCEPDATDHQRIKDESSRNEIWRDVRFVLEALSSSEGEAKLNITKKPGCSSLYEPNRAVINNFYGSDENPSIRPASMWEVNRRVSVPAVTLDNAAKKYSFENLGFYPGFPTS